MTSISSPQNEIIIKPFVYGSVAFYLGKKGKKGKEQASHKWCAYVRGVNNENISTFIKEVHFILHNSFANHIRKVQKWPFELYEVGWGEFDMRIKIFLIDETIKPIEVIHQLKLHPLQSHTSQSSKRPVVSEHYDEIIFVNPKPNIRELLLQKIEEQQESEKEPEEEREGMKMEVEENDQSTINDMKKDEMDVQEGSGEMVRSFNMQEGDKMQIEDGDELNDQNRHINADIPNLSSYFQTIDDSQHLKELEEANQFILKEIENVKVALQEKEKEIANLIKQMKEFK